MNTEIPEVLQKAIRLYDNGYDDSSKSIALLEVLKYQNEQIEMLKHYLKSRATTADMEIMNISPVMPWEVDLV